MKSFIVKNLKNYPKVHYAARVLERYLKNTWAKGTLDKRIINAIREFENPTKLKKRTKPIGSLIEITNACNLDCVMCNTKMSKRSTGFIEPSTFEKIIQQLGTVGIKTVGLHTVGETFMYKNLEALLEIVEQHGFLVWLCTNGQFPERIEPLFRKFPKLANAYRFSIDGATKETYEAIRRGGKFDKVLKSLETIYSINEGKKNYRISTSIYSILSTTNIYEIPDFFRIFGKYCWPESIEFNLVNGLSPDPSYFRETFPFPNLIRKVVPCCMPFNSVYFTYGGKVTLCCRDYDEELVVGDLSEDSLINIWNGLKAETIREKHLNPEKIDINSCKSCYGPNEAVTFVVNEYIHRLYGRNPELESREFGNKVLDILQKMDAAVGSKNIANMKRCVRDVFDTLN